MQKVYTRGRRVSQGGLTLGVIGLAVFLLLDVAQHADAAPCGPGPDWVDNCPSGTDRVNSRSQHGVIIFDPEDGGGVFPLPIMKGSTEVFRGPGTPGSTAGGSHHIDTEMVSLNLSGGGLTLRAGDGIANLLCDDGFLCTFGRIDERADQLTALSFFDVSFEISPTPFGPLHASFPHNEDPCRMEADIDRVPPAIGTIYMCTNLPIDLFDAGEVHRAILTGVVFHEIVPEPSILLLLGSGVAGLIGLKLMRRRSQKA